MAKGHLCESMLLSFCWPTHVYFIFNVEGCFPRHRFWSWWFLNFYTLFCSSMSLISFDMQLSVIWLAMFKCNMLFLTFAQPHRRTYPNNVPYPLLEDTVHHLNRLYRQDFVSILAKHWKSHTECSQDYASAESSSKTNGKVDTFHIHQGICQVILGRLGSQH